MLSFLTPYCIDDSLEMVKSRSNESQLLLSWVERKLFLFSWAKNNCDSLLLFLTTSKLSSMQEVARNDKITCCVHGNMQCFARDVCPPPPLHFWAPIVTSARRMHAAPYLTWMAMDGIGERTHSLHCSRRTIL